VKRHPQNVSIGQQSFDGKFVVFHSTFFVSLSGSTSPTHSLWMKTMNRCLHPPIIRMGMLLILGVAWMALGIPSPAAAQNTLRQFPPSAKRGMLVVTTPPAVLINGNAERLSPGARIKSADNALLMSSALVGSSVLVNYVRDGQGLIHEVWILSAQEAREKRAGMETVFNFTFASDADKPKTDDGKTPFNQLPAYPKH